MTPYVLQVVECKWLKWFWFVNRYRSLQSVHHSNLYGFLSLFFLVALLIACHFKPPDTNLPLSSRTQIPPNVTIDVGQDAIVANGTNW